MDLEKNLGQMRSPDQINPCGNQIWRHFTLLQLNLGPELQMKLKSCIIKNT